MIAASVNVDPVNCYEGTMQIIGLTTGDMFEVAVAARVFDKI